MFQLEKFQSDEVYDSRKDILEFSFKVFPILKNELQSLTKRLFNQQQVTKIFFSEFLIEVLKLPFMLTKYINAE